ncbi:MAG: YdcF family protein [Synechococcales bacterium]|nr:YdcF family protein [Synechococcales bacterium]
MQRPGRRKLDQQRHQDTPREPLQKKLFGKKRGRQKLAVRRKLGQASEPTPHASVSKRKRFRFRAWWLSLPLLFWVGQCQYRSLFTEPQAVLVLGGETSREQFAARFALEHPELPIWISSGAPQDYSEWVFMQSGINLQRVTLDYRAVDTLTNFTTLADDLKAKGITKIYLVTSDYHMRRARMVGEIVLGSRGIALKSIPIPSQQEEEPLTKALLDSGRAIVWVTTGYTGKEGKMNPEESNQSTESIPE